MSKPFRWCRECKGSGVIRFWLHEQDCYCNDDPSNCLCWTCRIRDVGYAVREWFVNTWSWIWR